jgi:hypothetical protein
MILMVIAGISLLSIWVLLLIKWHGDVVYNLTNYCLDYEESIKVFILIFFDSLTIYAIIIILKFLRQ